MLKKCNENKTVNAFTLSEVLLSLVIIGIIAAITLPLLFANYQQEHAKAALKKNYSVLKQALDRYQIDNGERLYALEGESLNLKIILKNYLTVMYDCGDGYTDANSACVPNLSAPSNNNPSAVSKYKTYNGSSMNAMSQFDDGQFVLNDGTLVLFNNDGNGHFISVDINGFERKPNTLGKDLFMFQLMSNGELLPMGASGTRYTGDNTYCSKSANNSLNGASCTNKLLYSK